MDESVSRLSTPEECEQYAKNVEAKHPDLAIAARRKAVELRASAHKATSDAEKEALQAIFAYEAAASQQKGRKVRASRTWQMVKAHGILGAVERAVNRRDATTGYEALVKAHLEDFAFEAVVTRYPDRFSADAVSRSTERLSKRATEGITPKGKESERR